MSNFYATFHEFDFGDIVLREIDPTKDSIAFYIYMNNPNVAPFLADCDRPSNIPEAISELQYWYSLFHSRRSIYWAIAESQTNKIIGTIGFNQYSETHKKLEVSYDLDHNFWGRGIISRTLNQIINLVLNEMDAIRIQATVACYNERSIKVLERLGFAQEGLMRNYCILEGKPVDYFMYAKLK